MRPSPAGASGQLSAPIPARGDDAERDHLDLLVLEGVAVVLPVPLVEARQQRRLVGQRERAVRHRAAQLEALPLVAALGDPDDTLVLGRDAVRRERVACALHQGIGLGVQAVDFRPGSPG